MRVRFCIPILLLSFLAGYPSLTSAQELPSAEKVVEEARALSDAGNPAAAIELLSRAETERGDGGDHFLFHKAWIQFTKLRKFEDAVGNFSALGKRYPESNLADDAYYYAGFIAQFHLNDSARALELYREGYQEYPQGDFRHSLADKLRQFEADFSTVPPAEGLGIAPELQGVTIGPVIRRAPPETDIRDTAPRRPDRARTVTMQFNEAPIRNFIEWVAQVTGRNFIIDERVSGNITVYSGKPLPFDEVYRVFLSILDVRGYAAVDAGDVTKIVPRGEAYQSELPIVLDENAYLPTDRVVTRIFRPTTISASAMQGLIRPFLTPTDQILVNAETNSLIVTGTGFNIERVQELIRMIESSRGAVELRSYRIQFGQASRIAEKINTLVTGFFPPGASIPPFRVIADERTNTLHVVADATMQQRAESLIAQLDVDKTPERIVHVFTLEYARAEDVVKDLQQLMGIGGKEEQIDYGGVQRTVLLPDPRLNSISISTFAPRVVDLVESYIAKVDQAPASDNRATHIVKLQYAQSEEMFTLLTSIFGATATPAAAFALGLSEKVNFAPDKRTNSIIVTATAADWTKVRALIDQLDLRKPQVLVEAVILETSLDEARNLGFNITTTDQPKEGSTRVVGGSVLFPPSDLANGGLAAAVTRGSVIGPALRALLTSSKTNVLQMPQILALDNEDASISVGDLTPFITSRAVDGDNVQIAGSSSIFQNVEYRNIGLNLKIKPHIGEKRDILLELDLEVQDRSSSAVAGLPVFTNRALNSKIQVSDGDYIVLGGLLRTQDQNSQRKTPWLSKIPILGVFFHSTNSSEGKTVLLIFLRPRVVNSSDEIFDVTEEERLQFEAEARTGLSAGRSELEKWIPESR